jgi:arabinofuranosyltransferase
LRRFRPLKATILAAVSQRGFLKRADAVLPYLLWGALAAFACWKGYSELWARRWVQDDAYISFRYARNFVEGQGLLYNPGQRAVEGYSNFTWVLLACIPFLFGRDDPIVFMHVVGLLLWVLSGALSAAILRKVIPYPYAVAPLAVAVLIQNSSYNQWFMSGMETPLVVACNLGTIFCFMNAVDSGLARYRYLLGAIAGFAAMTRMDDLFFIAGIFTTMALVATRKEELWNGAVAFLVFAATYGAYFAARLLYYGDIFPNTAYAKLGTVANYQSGWSYVRAFFFVYPELLPALPAVLILPIRLSHSNTTDRVFSAITISVLFQVLYILRIGGDFMEWRFMVPLIPLLQIAAYMIAVDFFLNPLYVPPQSSTARRLAAAFVSLLVAAQLVHRERERQATEDWMANVLVTGQENIRLLGRYANPPFAWGRIGLKLGELFGSSYVLATPAAGMIPFSSRMTTLDLYGINDYAIAHSKLSKFEHGEPRGRIGHEYQLTDVDFIRSRGADLLLDWPYLQLTTLPDAQNVPPFPGLALMSVEVIPGGWVNIWILRSYGQIRDSLSSRPDVKFYEEISTRSDASEPSH